MSLRPEKPFTDCYKPGAMGHPLAKGGVGLVQHYIGDTMVWRYGDEPGVYRDRGGVILPMEQVRRMVPGLAEELEVRAHQDDTARVAREVERLLAGGVSEVIETRGDYALVSVLGGGLVNLTRRGVNIHGAPLPEPMARRILDSLSPPPVVLSPALAA